MMQLLLIPLLWTWLVPLLPVPGSDSIRRMRRFSMHRNSHSLHVFRVRALATTQRRLPRRYSHLRGLMLRLMHEGPFPAERIRLPPSRHGMFSFIHSHNCSLCAYQRGFSLGGSHGRCAALVPEIPGVNLLATLPPTLRGHMPIPREMLQTRGVMRVVSMLRRFSNPREGFCVGVVLW
jgi:hypothetical protein